MKQSRFTLFAITAPYIWMLIFVALPFFLIAKISFSESVFGSPPYQPLFEGLTSGWMDKLKQFTLANYERLISDEMYVRSLLNSLVVAGLSTFLILLIGYPLAYAISRSSERWRNILLMMVVLPFWVSFLIRAYAWVGIIRREGLLNNFLLWLGAIDQPLEILNTTTAVYLGIVYTYLPFMILPLYANLSRHDATLRDAASDLGSPPWSVFWHITLPLSRRAIFAGCLLVFIPAVGEFVIPDLLGGSDSLMLGKVLWSEFFSNRDWPMAAALATVLMLLLLAPLMILQRLESREQRLTIQKNQKKAR